MASKRSSSAAPAARDKQGSGDGGGSKGDNGAGAVGGGDATAGGEVVDTVMAAVTAPPSLGRSGGKAVSRHKGQDAAPERSDAPAPSGVREGRRGTPAKKTQEEIATEKWHGYVANAALQYSKWDPKAISKLAAIEKKYGHKYDELKDRKTVPDAERAIWCLLSNLKKRCADNVHDTGDGAAQDDDEAEDEQDKGTDNEDEDADGGNSSDDNNYKPRAGDDAESDDDESEDEDTPTSAKGRSGKSPKTKSPRQTADKVRREAASKKVKGKTASAGLAGVRKQGAPKPKRRTSQLHASDEEEEEEPQEIARVPKRKPDRAQDDEPMENDTENEEEETGERNGRAGESKSRFVQYLI